MSFKDIFEIQDAYIFGASGLLILLLYFVTSSAIKNSRMTNDQKRRMLGKARGIFLLTIIVVFFIIWASELYQIILSLAAVAAGFAIAAKEVFLCFGGSFYRTWARPFSVGDRIEISGIRGDVVDIGLMGTQLMEVGPGDYTHQYTGRVISIPNSSFIMSNVFNETTSANEHDDYALHIIKIPVKNDENWKKHKEALTQCATEVCQKFTDPAAKFLARMAKKRQIDAPTVEPRINLKFISPDEIDFIVRVTVPVKQKGTIEREIIYKYLELIH